MKPSILGIIMEHFTAGRPVLADDAASDNGAGQSGHASDQDDNEIVVQIKELLDTRVRPAVAMDGGDIVFHSFDDGVVYLAMQGLCRLSIVDDDPEAWHRKHVAPLRARGERSSRRLNESHKIRSALPNGGKPCFAHIDSLADQRNELARAPWRA